MSEHTEIESALGYRQFTKACDLLQDLVAKLEAALKSPEVVGWRVPELQLELARAYEALSLDVEAEAAFSAAGATAKRLNGDPTSEEFVQFSLGEFYLRRRMYERALATSEFIPVCGPSPDSWLLLHVRAKAYAGLGRASEARESAQGYIAAAPDKEGARLQMGSILGRAS